MTCRIKEAEFAQRGRKSTVGGPSIGFRCLRVPSCHGDLFPDVIVLVRGGARCAERPKSVVASLDARFRRGLGVGGGRNCSLPALFQGCIRSGEFVLIEWEV